jgi:hypothetical protein
MFHAGARVYALTRRHAVDEDEKDMRDVDATPLLLRRFRSRRATIYFHACYADAARCPCLITHSRRAISPLMHILRHARRRRPAMPAIRYRHRLPPPRLHFSAPTIIRCRHDMLMLPPAPAACLSRRHFIATPHCRRPRHCWTPGISVARHRHAPPCFIFRHAVTFSR